MDLDLVTTLRSTGAVREFQPGPVGDDVLRRILETARFAPSGGNRQGWRVIVVKDPSVRAALRDIYLTGWYEYLAMGAAGLVPWAPVTDRAAESEAVARAHEFADAAAATEPGFAQALDLAPALLLVLADLSALAAVDRDLPRYTLVGGASIYPFVWSVLLARAPRASAASSRPCPSVASPTCVRSSASPTPSRWRRWWSSAAPSPLPVGCGGLPSTPSRGWTATRDHRSARSDVGPEDATPPRRRPVPRRRRVLHARAMC